MSQDPMMVPAEPPPGVLPVCIEAEITAVRGYVEASRAASTRKAYAADWRRFTAWCRDRDA